MTVHARSVFLQGVLVNDATLWPGFAAANGTADRVLAAVDRLVGALGRRSRADLCLAYVRGVPWVTQLLVGIRTKQQVHRPPHHTCCSPPTCMTYPLAWLGRGVCGTLTIDER